MSFVTAADGVRLYLETRGSGAPVVLAHELSGTCRSFDPQVAAWQGRFRSIAYNARGYPPSAVPPTLASYSQDIAASDIGAVLDGAGLADAHLVGVSMGSAAILQFALRHPGRVRSMVLCSIGSGSDLKPGEFTAAMEATAAQVERGGMAVMAENFAKSPTRRKLKDKNPAAFQDFMTQVSAMSATGIVNTMRGVQMRRPPLYAHRDAIAALGIPTLVVQGGDDAPCAGPSRFLAATLPGAVLEVVANTGHGVNLEEPEHFNRIAAAFIDAAEAARP